MATVTVAIAGTGDTTNAASYVSGSFTPVAGDLLVILCDATGSSGITATASANGITFTNRIASLSGTSANQGAILTADQLVGVSPSAMTVTVAVAGGNATGADITVSRVSGMTKVGAAAVRQVAHTDNTGAGTTPNVVFPGVCLTGNVVLIGLSNATSPAGLTPPTSFTEGGDTGYATPTHGFEWAYRNSGHTSATVTWGGASASLWGAMGVELDTTTASATATPAVAVAAIGAVNQASVSTTNTRGFALAFQGELNRLAGTVGRGEAAAANIWAGTTGLSTLAALNHKAGNAAGVYRGFGAVCNQLAGTSGLAPAGALSHIPA
jgi:hypothetical protein